MEQMISTNVFWKLVRHRKENDKKGEAIGGGEHVDRASARPKIKIWDQS